MARFDRLTVLSTMLSTGLIPVFYHSDLSVARQVITACAEGGIRVFEFTNRGDGAWQVFNELMTFCQKNHPKMILGIGSIVDAPTAALYLAGGANFVVGPTLNPEVARLCNRRKIAYSPGCGSVSEISAAEELGVEIVKVFPGGEVGGPAFISAARGPMPWSRLMPTGGIDCTAESVQAWIKAGAACIGMGSKLIPKEALAGGNFDLIRANARQVLNWIQQAREA